MSHGGCDQPEVVEASAQVEKTKPPRRAGPLQDPAPARQRPTRSGWRRDLLPRISRALRNCPRGSNANISNASHRRCPTHYRNNFDPVLKAVKIATAQAAEIVRVTGGDEDVMSGALLRLVQTAIFDLLVELQRSKQLIARIPAAYEHVAKIEHNRKLAARRIERTDRRLRVSRASCQTRRSCRHHRAGQSHRTVEQGRDRFAAMARADA